MIRRRGHFATVMAAVLILCLFSSGALCQKRVNETRSNLELQLNLGEFRDGLPTQFVILLVNTGKQDVYVPETNDVNCRNRWRGTINLHLAINGGEGISRGCPGDGSPEQIEVRVLSWVALRPGDSLQLGKGEEHFQHQNVKSGKYSFWADYYPPEFTDADRVWLKTAGIRVPQSELASKFYEFQK